MLRGTVRAKERKRKSREVGEVAVLLLTGLTAAGSRAYISSRGSCRLEGTSRGKVITACPVPAHSPTHCAEPTPAPAPEPEPRRESFHSPRPLSLFPCSPLSPLSLSLSLSLLFSLPRLLLHSHLSLLISSHPHPHHLILLLSSLLSPLQCISPVHTCTYIVCLLFAIS